MSGWLDENKLKSEMDIVAIMKSDIKSYSVKQESILPYMTLYQFLYNAHVTVSLFMEVEKPPWFILSFATRAYVFSQMRLTVCEAWSLENKATAPRKVLANLVLRVLA